MQKPLDNFRIHSGDDFLGSLVDVVFHCRDLGLGVEQVSVGIYGDHVAYGRLVCHFVNLCIFIQYRTDSTTAEFVAGLGGHTVHLFRKADLFKITSADCKSTVVGHAVNLAGDLNIQWLEDFLITSAKAVIVISHDRKFVDNITTRTIEVTMGRIYDYKVNYSQYLVLRKERREQQMKQYEEQQKMIQETKDFIERFKGTYSKTLQVQSRVKMLEKLELVEVDEEDTSALRLKFPPSPRSGNYPVIMDGVRWKKDRIQQRDYKRQKRAASKIGCFFTQLGGAYGTKSE